MKLVECVPNFSEGRRPEVVHAIRDAIQGINGVTILDVSSDASHNRTVITFVAPLANAVDAALAGIREARDRIDLTAHTGEHPRIGATDVVPFIPLEGSTMEDCIGLARELGARVGAELGIPVYLYERAASRPSRENLADVRRGEFETLLTEIGTNPDRDPDFGPQACHPTAGAVAIGARPFLVAYNIYLGPSANLPVAKKVAKSVRGSSGGFKYVKGLGLDVDGQAQVSMNLVDTIQTPMHHVFDFVRQEAESQGVNVTWSEIVGLVPEKALFDAAASHLQLTKFTPGQVLEQKVREATSGGTSVDAFLSSFASSDPVPGGGSAAAHAGALGAALIQMVAGLTIGKKKYASVEWEMKEISLQAAALSNKLSALVERDAEAFAAVSEAYKLTKESESEKIAREIAVDKALLGAAEIPLETARACCEVVRLAVACAERGNQNAVTDAGVAALLADSGARGAAYNVLVNLKSLSNNAAGTRMAEELKRVMAEADKLAGIAKTRVESVVA